MPKVIRFLARVGVYNPGEVAGFDEPVADAYIESGVAEPFTPPSAAPATPVENPDDPRHDPLAFAKGTERKGHRKLGK